MAEARDSEIPNNNINQQQMVELQPLLSSSQPSDLSSNVLPQQQCVEDAVTINIKQMIQHCEDGLCYQNVVSTRCPLPSVVLKKRLTLQNLFQLVPFIMVVFVFTDIKL